VQLVSESIRDIMGLDDPYDLSTWFANIHPEDIDRVAAAQVRSVEEVQSFNQIMRIYHPVKEEWRWIHAISHPLFSEKENRIYYNGIILDITERKRAEEELINSENRFQYAMEATKDGLFDLDLVTNQIYYSPGWKQMLGYKYDELPNDFSVWETLTDPEDVKRSWEMQQELINKQRDL